MKMSAGLFRYAEYWVVVRAVDPVWAPVRRQRDSSIRSAGEWKLQIYKMAEMVALGYPAAEPVTRFEYGHFAAVLQKQIGTSEAREASTEDADADLLPGLHGVLSCTLSCAALFHGPKTQM